jgi:hypothetical protein
MSASCIVLSHVRVSLFFRTDETCCVDPIRSSEFLSALSQMSKVHRSTYMSALYPSLSLWHICESASASIEGLYGRE